MQVGTLAVQHIFERDVHYSVPRYQRPYVWNEADQWAPLWEDLQSLALTIAAGTSARAHFMGASVQERPAVPPGHIETRVLIDGQQRLTTLQLLLKAFHDITRARGNEPYSQALDKLVRNNHPLSREPQHQLKVWPTTADRDDFRAVMDASDRSALLTDLGFRRAVKRVKRNIPDAYLYFSEAIEHWLAENPEAADARIAGLYSAIRDNVRIVVIDLDERDDPQVIFETLNARGTPLLSADLVKNSLLNEIQLEGGDVEAAYDKYWRKFDANAGFWRTQVGRGHAQRARIETFLQHALTLMSGTLVSASHLYSAYRDFARSTRGGSAIERLNRFHDYGVIYKSLQDDQTRPRVTTFFDRLRTLDVVTAWPFILALYERRRDDPEETEAVLVDLESFLVRRMVCRLSTRGYGEVFASLTASLTRDPDRATELVRAFLMKGTAEADRWPTDEEFATAWNNNPLYENVTRARLRMLLEAMEAGLRNEFAETKSVPKDLTIEHIMPQGWREHWDQPLQLTAEVRDRSVHTIGNLTLLNEKFNAHQSNRRWINAEGPNKGKREALDRHSVLYLNKGLVQFDEWSEAHMADRSKALLSIALKVWPRPTGQS